MLMVRDWDTPLRKPWDLNQAQIMVGVQRSFLSKEKRDAKARIAGDDLDVASSDLEVVRQEIAVEVRKACADLKRIADEMLGRAGVQLLPRVILLGPSRAEAQP